MVDVRRDERQPGDPVEGGSLARSGQRPAPAQRQATAGVTDLVERRILAVDQRLGEAYGVGGSRRRFGLPGYDDEG